MSYGRPDIDEKWVAALTKIVMDELRFYVVGDAKPIVQRIVQDVILSSYRHGIDVTAEAWFEDSMQAANDSAAATEGFMLTLIEKIADGSVRFRGS